MWQMYKKHDYDKPACEVGLHSFPESRTLQMKWSHRETQDCLRDVLRSHWDVIVGYSVTETTCLINSGKVMHKWLWLDWSLSNLLPHFFVIAYAIQNKILIWNWHKNLLNSSEVINIILYILYKRDLLRTNVIVV